MTTTAPQRELVLGGKRYPLVLPSLSDARLHLASVVVSIHLLGQIGLGFRVSVPQILVAIVSAGLIDAVVAFRRSGSLVWPASAMLTGSGVALIFRVVGTDRGDHWTWRGWYLFALVAAVSVASKYLIRFRGEHLFNPSNLGLVVAFLLLGSGRVEPLDFWWSPLNGWMIAAYLVIVGGGLAITARLRLLPMAVAFWIVFAAALGILAGSGHCMTAAWAFAPVCGIDFWRVVVTSPEVAIFLFFMITDPKTVPKGRAARIGFSIAIALLAVLLIAPQSTEFGAKVGLLSALVIMSPLRSRFDRALPEPPPGQALGDAVLARWAGAPPSAARVFTRGTFAGTVVGLVVVSIVAAGIPARQGEAAGAVVSTGIEVDSASLPPVTRDPEVDTLAADLAAGDGAGLAMILAESLALEAEAMRRGDPNLLLAVDQGERLAELEHQIDEAASRGERAVASYRFDSIHVRVVHPEGPQTAPRLAFDVAGTRRESVYGVGDVAVEESESPLVATFLLGQGGDGGWRIVEATVSGAN